MKWKLLVGFLLVSSGIFAQQKFETDRPNETRTPALTPKNSLQGEIGIRREKQTNYNHFWNHPNALLKLGLANWIEFRMETKYSTYISKFIDRPGEIKVTGVEPLQLGTKIKLASGKTGFPQTSFIGQIGINPIASRELQTPEPIASLRLAMQNNLATNAQLGYNLGFRWTGYSSSPEFLYTFSPAFDLNDKLQLSFEVFGFIGKEDFHDHNLDVALQYAIADNFKADIATGVGLSQASSKHFIEIGFAFRIPK